MNLEPKYQHEQRHRKEPPKGVTRLPEKYIDQAEMAYITNRGLDAELAIANGWYVSHNARDYYPRVVMPATNTLGYVYWQGRAIGFDGGRRYQSPPYASGDSIIIVWPEKPSRRVAIVEGPFDALAAAGEGWIGVALMGKNPQQEVYDHIVSRFPGHEMVVVADADGIQAAGQIVSTLAARGIPVQLKLTGYKDLAAMPSEHRERLLAW